MRITRVETVACQLGEGPVWDARDQALWFVDIFGQQVHRHSPGDGTTRSWEMPANVGAVAPCRDRGAVVALADGIHALDLESGATTPVALIEDLPPGVVLNDGKVDRRGRFVVGTIDTKIAAPLGQFLSFQAGKLRVIADGFTVGNGPCWSPDNQMHYLADSLALRIYAYDYDIGTGDVATAASSRRRRRSAASPTARPSTPTASYGSRSAKARRSSRSRPMVRSSE